MIARSGLSVFLHVSVLALVSLVMTACSDNAPKQDQASQAAPHTPIAQAPTAPAKTVSPAARPGLVPQGSGFDFYVLSLSWSPSYCAAEGDRADRRQCGRSGPKGFVVHGLWPQYHRGGYPADCRSSEPERVPQQLLSAQRDLFPSDGLAAHEWRKHGTCSGLSQADYFKVTRMARQKLRMPQSLGGTVSAREAENAFIVANRGLDPDEIAIDCDRTFLREVQICFDKALEFTACPDVDRRGCRAGRMLMPTN